MKKIIQAVIAVVVIASMTGCASTKAYFIDRGRDAADIFTVTVGEGGGAKARVGPLQIGLWGNHDVAGLMGGELGFWGVTFPSIAWASSSWTNGVVTDFEMGIMWAMSESPGRATPQEPGSGFQCFIPTSTVIRQRHKQIQARSFLIPTFYCGPESPPITWRASVLYST